MCEAIHVPRLLCCSSNNTCDLLHFLVVTHSPICKGTMHYVATRSDFCELQPRTNGGAPAFLAKVFLAIPIIYLSSLQLSIVLEQLPNTYIPTCRSHINGCPLLVILHKRTQSYP